MNRFAPPLLCAAIVGATVAAALSQEGVIHAFPDATRRPPLRVILADARSHNANHRYVAIRYLAFYRSERAYEALLLSLQDPDFLIRLNARPR